MSHENYSQPTNRNEAFRWRTFDVRIAHAEIFDSQLFKTDERGSSFDYCAEYIAQQANLARGEYVARTDLILINRTGSSGACYRKGTGSGLIEAYKFERHQDTFKILGSRIFKPEHTPVIQLEQQDVLIAELDGRPAYMSAMTNINDRAGLGSGVFVPLTEAISDYNLHNTQHGPSAA